MPVGVFIDNEPAVRDRLKVLFFPSFNVKKRRIVADSFLVLFNADYENVSLHLGGRARDLNWELMLDTSAFTHGEPHS